MLMVPGFGRQQSGFHCFVDSEKLRSIVNFAASGLKQKKTMKLKRFDENKRYF